MQQYEHRHAESGADVTTTSVPILPPAPGRFSVTKDWPRWSVSHCPISRAVMSTPPPAAKPATIFTGRVG
jgi:hypothetical protein